jgi:hypothetical protein
MLRFTQEPSSGKNLKKLKALFGVATVVDLSDLHTTIDVEERRLNSSSFEPTGFLFETAAWIG